MMKIYSLLLTLLLCTARTLAHGFSTIPKHSRYVLQFSSHEEIKAGPISVNANGRTYSTADRTLEIQDSYDVKGSDILGRWNGHTTVFGVKDAHLNVARFETTVKYYEDNATVIFSQRFPDGLNYTKLSEHTPLVSGFPSFLVQKGDKDLLGVMTYGCVHLTCNTITRWEPGTTIVDGVEGGPIVIFNSVDEAYVISAFSQFMIAGHSFNKTSSVISWGILGKVKSVPPGFQIDTITHHSSTGINKAMEGWGRVLRRWHKKDSTWRYEDPTVKYLGYYTDNGAYYYHVTEPGLNYEQTLLAELQYAKKKHIPYRYIQYDDWFYYYRTTPKDSYGGTVKWDAKPSIFPHGMRNLYNKTVLPVIAHNRYWSSKVVYATENGGKWKFLIQGIYSIPLEQEFWDWLFSTAVQWGMTTYEQDWLNQQMEYLEAMQSDVYFAQRWMSQMDRAAQRYGLHMQLCMVLPRHVLQSLEMPSVSQARMSQDYALDKNQYRIGIAAMFGDAVGLTPSKDNFWTIQIQPGSKYPHHPNEPNPLLQATVALLTTGPVGPSDRIGYSNASLINSLCRLDGVLLKPDKPAKPIDAQIIQAAYGGSVGPKGELWTTYSEISGWVFGVIFAEISGTYALKPSQGFSGKISGRNLVLSHRNTASTPAVFSESYPLTLRGCTHQEFCLYYSAPIMEWRKKKVVALLGELSKLVPMSSRRVSNIFIDRGSSRHGDIRVDLTGAPYELVYFHVFVSPKKLIFECTMNYLGTATLSLADNRCG